MKNDAIGFLASFLCRYSFVLLTWITARHQSHRRGESDPLMHYQLNSIIPNSIV